MSLIRELYTDAKRMAEIIYEKYQSRFFEVIEPRMKITFPCVKHKSLNKNFREGVVPDEKTIRSFYDNELHTLMDHYYDATTENLAKFDKFFGEIKKIYPDMKSIMEIIDRKITVTLPSDLFEEFDRFSATGEIDDEKITEILSDATENCCQDYNINEMDKIKRFFEIIKDRFLASTLFYWDFSIDPREIFEAITPVTLVSRIIDETYIPNDRWVLKKTVSVYQKDNAYIVHSYDYSSYCDGEEYNEKDSLCDYCHVTDEYIGNVACDFLGYLRDINVFDTKEEMMTYLAETISDFKYNKIRKFLKDINGVDGASIFV
jgi:hypothetical protein